MTSPLTGAPSEPAPELKLPRLSRGRLTISSEVTDALRWRIIEGTLPPGTRLGEEKISREMDISRGPVREALRELENEGLLVVEPYRGAVVIGISEAELRSVLIPVRWILEKSAVEQAIRKMSDEDFEVLAEITRKMRDVADSGSETTLRELVELDVTFHRIVVEFSGDYHTKQLWLAIQPRIRMGFYQLGARHYHSSEIAEEHEELLTALRSRDLATVLAALDAHAMTSPLELLDRGALQAKPDGSS
jgi:DNA-binding GntR family transcriptional regulator